MLAESVRMALPKVKYDVISLGFAVGFRSLMDPPTVIEFVEVAIPAYADPSHLR